MVIKLNLYSGIAHTKTLWLCVRERISPYQHSRLVSVMVYFGPGQDRNEAEIRLYTESGQLIGWSCKSQVYGVKEMTGHIKFQSVTFINNIYDSCGDRKIVFQGDLFQSIFQ